MRKSTIAGLLAVPLIAGGLYWLMLHGHIESAAIGLALAVLALIVGAAWQFWHRRARWGGVLLAGALIVCGGVGAYAWSLNNKIDNIDRVPTTQLSEGARPPKVKNHTLNILLLGADDPAQLVKKPSVAELLADGTWNPGAYRSDTLMVVHIPKDRKAAYTVSIPRDSYVPIYDAEGKQHGSNKINAAFSDYGPLGTLRTVENLSGLRIDHLAVIDYAGFRDLTSAVGGVDVYVPETVYDSKQDQEWTKGWHHIEGILAEKYVRQRYGLLGGDFDRVDRQQNFLRALMGKVLAEETIGNPLTFSKTMAALTENLTIDDEWSTADLRSLALSLRGLDSTKVRFMTLPLDEFQVIDGAGEVNIIDAIAAKELWKAVSNDTVATYLKKHPDDELPDPKDVH